MLLAATQALQPNVRNVARSTRPSASKRTYSVMDVSRATSSTRPMRWASTSRPTLRGRWKWSTVTAV
jgi:hypothetical protein